MSENKPGIGHNNPPPDEPQRFNTHTIYLSVDPETGERQLLSEWEIRPWRARPLPGRDKHGLQRPARDYAFEKAVAKLNKLNRRGK